MGDRYAPRNRPGQCLARQAIETRPTRPVLMLVPWIPIRAKSLVGDEGRSRLNRRGIGCNRNRQIAPMCNIVGSSLVGRKRTSNAHGSTLCAMCCRRRAIARAFLRACERMASAWSPRARSHLFSARERQLLVVGNSLAVWLARLWLVCLLGRGEADRPHCDGARSGP